MEKSRFPNQEVALINRAVMNARRKLKTFVKSVGDEVLSSVRSVRSGINNIKQVFASKCAKIRNKDLMHGLQRPQQESQDHMNTEKASFGMKEGDQMDNEKHPSISEVLPSEVIDIKMQSEDKENHRTGTSEQCQSLQNKQLDAVSIRHGEKEKLRTYRSLESLIEPGLSFGSTKTDEHRPVEPIVMMTGDTENDIVFIEERRAVGSLTSPIQPDLPFCRTKVVPQVGRQICLASDVQHGFGGTVQTVSDPDKHVEIQQNVYPDSHGNTERVTDSEAHSYCQHDAYLDKHADDPNDHSTVQQNADPEMDESIRKDFDVDDHDSVNQSADSVTNVNKLETAVLNNNGEIQQDRCPNDYINIDDHDDPVVYEHIQEQSDAENYEIIKQNDDPDDRGNVQRYAEQESRDKLQHLAHSQEHSNAQQDAYPDDKAIVQQEAGKDDNINAQKEADPEIKAGARENATPQACDKVQQTCKQDLDISIQPVEILDEFANVGNIADPDDTGNINQDFELDDYANVPKYFAPGARDIGQQAYDPNYNMKQKHDKNTGQVNNKNTKQDLDPDGQINAQKYVEPGDRVQQDADLEQNSNGQKLKNQGDNGNAQEDISLEAHVNKHYQTTIERVHWTVDRDIVQPEVDLENHLNFQQDADQDDNCNSQHDADQDNHGNAQENAEPKIQTDILKNAGLVPYFKAQQASDTHNHIGIQQDDAPDEYANVYKTVDPENNVNIDQVFELDDHDNVESLFVPDNYIYVERDACPGVYNKVQQDTHTFNNDTVQDYAETDKVQRNSSHNTVNPYDEDSLQDDTATNSDKNGKVRGIVDLEHTIKVKCAAAQDDHIDCFNKESDKEHRTLKSVYLELEPDHHQQDNVQQGQTAWHTRLNTRNQETYTGQQEFINTEADQTVKAVMFDFDCHTKKDGDTIEVRMISDISSAGHYNVPIQVSSQDEKIISLAASKQESNEIQALKTENEMLRKKLCCVVCLEARRRILFLPCCHLVCCVPCADQADVCPEDNQDINERILVHFD